MREKSGDDKFNLIEYLRVLVVRTRSFFISKHGLGAVIFLFASVVTAAMTPPLLGIDEHYHYNRAYQVSRGGIVSDVVGDKIGGEVPLAMLRYQHDVIEARYSNLTKDTGWKSYTKRAFTTPLGAETAMANYPGAAAYNPYRTYLLRLVYFLQTQKMSV